MSSGGAGEWQDPTLPVEEPESSRPDPSEIDFTSFAYEIGVRSNEKLSKEVVEGLQRNGLAVFAWGRRGLWAGASTLDEAEALADRLRVEGPA